MGAHYREACRARSTNEFVSKIDGALMELEESCYWIELLIGAELVDSIKLLPLLDECGEITAILLTCAKNAKHGGAEQGE